MRTRKLAEFREYLNIEVTPEEVKELEHQATEIDVNLLEILAYGAPLKVKFSVTWNDDKNMWIAALYGDQRGSELEGIGIRGGHAKLEVAISLLALKITKIGRSSWLELVSSRSKSDGSYI